MSDALERGGPEGASHGPWPPRPEGWRHDAPDPPDAFAVPWRIRDGIVLLLLPLVMGTVVGAVFAGFGVGLEGDTRLLLVSAVVQLATFAAALLWLRARRSMTWHLLGPLRPTARHVAVGVGIGASGWVIVFLLLAVIVSLVGLDRLPEQETLERVVGGGAASLVLGVVIAVVLAPIVEEFVYRSVLFQALRERLGLFPAMGISAFVFGGLHVELILNSAGEFEPAGLVGMFGLVLLGFWLAAAFHRTGSLVVPVVGHATFNLISLVLRSAGTG